MKIIATAGNDYVVQITLAEFAKLQGYRSPYSLQNKPKLNETYDISKTWEDAVNGRSYRDELKSMAQKLIEASEFIASVVQGVEDGEVRHG